MTLLLPKSNRHFSLEALACLGLPLLTDNKEKRQMIDYKSYIHSPEWQATRKRWLDSGLLKECYFCTKPYEPGFHLHHRTYKNLGKERLMDLVLCCESCHTEVHKLERKYNLNIWIATKKARKLLHPDRKAANDRQIALSREKSRI